MELRGLEPLTFSLRNLLLGEGCPALWAIPRCTACILILVMIWRSTYGAHVWPLGPKEDVQSSNA